MDRKDFLNIIGMSATAFALINCIGCKKTDGSSAADTTGPTGVNFTHESYTLTYQSANSRFYCPNHGATFSENGAVTNGPASRSLTVYNTQLTGTTLKVYS